MENVEVAPIKEKSLGEYIAMIIPFEMRICVYFVAARPFSEIGEHVKQMKRQCLLVAFSLFSANAAAPALQTARQEMPGKPLC